MWLVLGSFASNCARQLCRKSSVNCPDALPVSSKQNENWQSCSGAFVRHMMDIHVLSSSDMLTGNLPAAVPILFAVCTTSPPEKPSALRYLFPSSQVGSPNKPGSPGASCLCKDGNCC
ncbi:hypothetical protein CIB84_005998 [Bambusicola thoracicus]|uniref:Uncharacterized protein n=1 Tax=Bambusicola thoracicus TaxID=9083 RepID=A0A2P4T1L6_BAMTH|nr:hypothetical protein CIB84_005998 [Bambusicola thoracicus]